MPELPEVETVRVTLAPIVGARIADVWYSGLRLHTGRPVDIAGLRAACAGATIEAVRRWGKFLLVDLADRPGVVVVHLGMSGRLRIAPASEPRAPHTHVVWALGERELRFSDPRRFGIVSLAERGREREHPSLAGLGPDPLVHGLHPAAFHDAARGSRQAVKAFLLDQRRIAGIGNIYASEALWLARVKPSRRTHTLTRAQRTAVLAAIPAVLRHALDHGGTSLRDFVDADGKTGDNQQYLRVYDRAGERCRRRGCGGIIKRTLIQGRATFACPSCQR